MKTDVEELSPTRVKLSVEVPFDELQPSIDKEIIQPCLDPSTIKAVGSGMDGAKVFTDPACDNFAPGSPAARPASGTGSGKKKCKKVKRRHGHKRKKKCRKHRRGTRHHKIA